MFLQLCDFNEVLIHMTKNATTSKRVSSKLGGVADERLEDALNILFHN